MNMMRYAFGELLLTSERRMKTVRKTMHAKVYVEYSACSIKRNTRITRDMGKKT